MMYVAIVIFLFLLAKTSLAQSTTVGTILGTVKDSAGAVIPQARVTISDTDHE